MSSYENLSEIQQFACRVIADHARATAFSIADGILPGNEGRNYVLRKIMRRAIYHGREHLGFKDLFFYKVCDKVVEEMHEAYPELEAQREFIGKMVRLEEERFGNTLTVGLKKLNELLEGKDFGPEPDRSGPESVKFTELAKLYDTFGTPIDLMYVVLRSSYPRKAAAFGSEQEFWMLEGVTGEWPDEKKEYYSLVETNPFILDDGGVGTYDWVTVIDEERFRELMEKAIQKLQQSSDIGKTQRNATINPIYVSLERTSVRSTFHGYETTRVDDTEVVAVVKDDKRVQELREGEEGLVVLKATPFYAEAGGQVGDSGVLYNSEVQVSVRDTFAPLSIFTLHKVKIESGVLKMGDKVTAVVDAQKRDATRRNHTATHLAHAALKEVLGSHVKQAGSVVAPNYLRFDFTHYQPVTAEEMEEIENLVNRYILENHPVNTDMMSIEEAMHSGAVALFGEKYGSSVRVLSVGGGDFSKELCGGTHVKATGDIGSFKITSDEAIASGVRRIRAITGFDAFERFREDERLIDRSLGALKTQRDNLPNAIERLQEELKRTRKEIEDLKLKIATGAIGSASANGDEAKDVAGVKVIGKIVEGLDANGTRQLSDTLLARLKSGIVVLGRRDEGKVGIIVRVSDDLTDRVKAGNVIKEIAPIVGGRGGGKPDMAEGGGNIPEKLPEAIESSLKIIENFLTA